ncbi:unnamed protein product [Effrenium voratum]|nr:unnamed protein product [Effrenium voratum]
MLAVARAQGRRSLAIKTSVRARELPGREISTLCWRTPGAKSSRAPPFTSRVAGLNGSLCSRSVSYASLKEQVKKNGKVFIVWWTFLWLAPVLPLFLIAEYFEIDLVAALEQQTGWDVASHVNPNWANIGAAVAVNECLELVRFPLVVATTPALARFVARAARH